MDNSFDNEKLKIELGQRVLKMRKKHGMTQEMVAEKAKLQKQTISKIETAKQDDPHSSSIIGLSEALGVSTDYLLKGIHTNDDLHPMVAKLLLLKEDEFDFIETVIDSYFKLKDKGVL